MQMAGRILVLRPTSLSKFTDRYDSKQYFIFLAFENEGSFGSGIINVKCPIYVSIQFNVGDSKIILGLYRLMVVFGMLCGLLGLL